MDPNYESRSAARQLEHIASERCTSPMSSLQLSRCTKTSDWPSAYKVVQTGSLWRLARAVNEASSSASSEVNEAVFLIQGIIWRHDLPPFRNQSITPKRTKYLRQSVSLTGLGSPKFEASLKGILDVYALFSSYVGSHSLKACSICDNFCGEYSSLESSNRYFTSAKDAPLEKHIPFSPEIDPQGILSGLASPIYIQCENNIVEYFERTVLPAGETRYAHIPPVRFQVGDIVEAQISLMLVPLQGHQYQMVSVIRSLALLDNSFTQKAFIAQAALAMLPKKTPMNMVVKRKVGYAEEELANKRGRSSAQAMEVDSENPNASNESVVDQQGRAIA